MKRSWCPYLSAGLIWDLTADIELEENYDESLHNLAVIFLLLALEREKQRENSPTGPTEGNLPDDWMGTATCRAPVVDRKSTCVEWVTAWRL